MDHESAYLDTSVLAHWSIYYRKRKWWQEFREGDKARQSMELFQEIKQRKYQTSFLTSEWALAELYQSALDYRIAVRMIRDGRNPRFFQTQKHRYPLSGQEMEAIALSLETFILHMKRNGVEIGSPEPLRYEQISMFSLNYGIEAPDALHLYFATTLKSDYFLTVDEPLKDAGVKEIEVMYPSTFRLLSLHSKKVP